MITGGTRNKIYMMVDLVNSTLEDIIKEPAAGSHVIIMITLNSNDRIRLLSPY